MSRVYLTDLCHGIYDKPTVDTLMVPFLGNERNVELLGVLLRVCSQFKVKHLVLLDNMASGQWLEIFKTYASQTEQDLDLSNLVSVTLNLTVTNYVFVHILNRTLIKRVYFRTPPISYSGLNAFMNRTFTELGGLPLFYNGSVLGIFFLHQDTHDDLGVEKAICPFGFLPYKWDGAALENRKLCQDWVDRNRLARDRCRKSVVAMVGLRKYRKSEVLNLMVKEVVGIIGGMVWQSRTTRKWDDQLV